MPPTPNENQKFDPHSSCAAQYACNMRRYRERERLTQPEVGAACNVSDKQISAIENLRRIPTLDVSIKLDRLYEVDYFEDQYWHVIREAGISHGFRSYAEQEQEAASLRTYEPVMIPGLFQSESYARQVLQAEQRAELLDQAVAVRMSRQEILEREEPAFVVAVLKESVLRELVGGRDVMREQLAHLIEMGRRPRNTIQVIPTGAPAYASGAFTILGYTDGADIGYVQGAIGQGHLVEPPATVHRMTVRFDQIRGEALHVPESERLIRSIMEDM